MDEPEHEETETDRGITLICRIALGVCLGIMLARAFELVLLGITLLIKESLK